MKNDGNLGWAILGFFFPFIGALFYAMWRDSHPLDAKNAGTGALFGFLVQVLLILYLFVKCWSTIYQILSSYSNSGSYYR